MSNPIGWCDCTINPVVGCTKCSPGCENCYAEKFAARLVKNPKTAKKYAGVVDACGKWTGQINHEGWGCLDTLPESPKRVFLGSMTDIFHENSSESIFDDLVDYMQYVYPQHTFLILTKRPHIAKQRIQAIPLPKNVWLGVTVCNQEEADAKLPVLMEINAHKRFVSIEPMLDAIDIGKWVPGSYECASCFSRFPSTYTPELCCRECGFSGPDTNYIWSDDGESAQCPKCGAWESQGAISYECPECGGVLMDDHPDTPYLDWIICGGESGSGARPMQPDWVRLLRDQCANAGVPFYFKGWGRWMTMYSGVIYPSQRRPVRFRHLLDGREWREFPAK